MAATLASYISRIAGGISNRFSRGRREPAHRRRSLCASIRRSVSASRERKSCLMSEPAARWPARRSGSAEGACPPSCVPIRKRLSSRSVVNALELTEQELAAAQHEDRAECARGTPGGAPGSAQG